MSERPKDDGIEDPGSGRVTETSGGVSGLLREAMRTNRTVASVLNERGEPSENLLQLLTLFDIEGCATVEDVKVATQEQWYQKGKLRAEIVEQHGSQKESAMELLRELSFFDAWHAEAGEYDGVLLLGATVVAVRKRLAFLMQEWQRGVRFSRLSLLGSTRSLLKDKESSAVLLNPHNVELPFPEDWSAQGGSPMNEAEMMEMVLDQAKIAGAPWQETASSLILCAPPQEGRNATTADTLRDWIRQSDTRKEKKVIAVSSQPFIPFQDIVTRNTLPPSFQVRTVGPAGGEALPMTVHLDNLAKLIYEIVHSKSHTV